MECLAAEPAIALAQRGRSNSSQAYILGIRDGEALRAYDIKKE